MTAHNAVIHDLWLDGHGGVMPADGDKGIEHYCRWVHLDYSKRGLGTHLRGIGVHNDVIHAMKIEETRPRCTTLAGGTLLILRGVNLNPGAQPDDMVSLRCWTDGRLLVTSRHRELLSIRDIRDTLISAKGPRCVGGLLAAIVERLTERKSEVMEAIADEAVQLEEDVLEEKGQDVRQPLLALRRRLIILRRYLAPQRDALARLQLDSPAWLEAGDMLLVRESADRLVRFVEDLDSLRERLAVIQEEYLGRHNELLNQRMYMLAVFTMIFLPLGFLTGLLGVNLNGIPFAERGFAFPLFFGLLCVLVVIQTIVLWRRKWF